MSKASLAVLLIEDNPGDTRLIRETLAEAERESVTALRFNVTVADRLSQGLAILDAGRVDIILLDLSLPDSQGLNTVIPIVTQAPAVPVVVLTGLNDEMLAMEAMRSGAQDYLVKGQSDSKLLARAIYYAIERKRAEEGFRSVVESSPNAIILVAPDGRISFANSRAEVFFGYDRAELHGLNIDSLVPEPFRADHEGQRLDFLSNPSERPMGHGRDLYGLRRDGSKFPAEIGLTPLETPVGLLVMATIVDITERRQAEEALQAKNEEIKLMTQQLWQAAKLATMGELAASIAHELNNPLATVSLRVEMLSGQVSPDSAQSRSLQIIESEVKRMGTLVANLLQYSRRSSSQLSPVKLNEEAVNSLELIQYHLRKNSIRTVQELSPDLPPIQADRQQLRQVFLNLFTNAADAMPSGGVLTIRTWSGEKPDERITAPLHHSNTASSGLPVSNLPQVFIEVSDTGEGFPSENLDRVWEPFFTTKPEGRGTGLGLAICRRIIQEHGGTIEIISEGIPGKGTTIRITLPALKGV